MVRFDGLKVVASSPERLARPEADNPFSAASVSIARQTSSCFIGQLLFATDSSGLRPDDMQLEGIGQMIILGIRAN